MAAMFFKFASEKPGVHGDGCLQCEASGGGSYIIEKDGADAKMSILATSRRP
jgi:hypothetical protein